MDFDQIKKCKYFISVSFEKYNIIFKMDIDLIKEDMIKRMGFRVKPKELDLTRKNEEVKQQATDEDEALFLSNDEDVVDEEGWSDFEAE